MKVHITGCIDDALHSFRNAAQDGGIVLGRCLKQKVAAAGEGIVAFALGQSVKDAGDYIVKTDALVGDDLSDVGAADSSLELLGLPVVEVISVKGGIIRCEGGK